MPSSVTIDLLSFGVGIIVGLLLFIAVLMPILTREQR
jgi:hypothetical protein